MKLDDIPLTLLQLIQSRAGGGEEWPAPQSVARPLSPVHPFEPDLLPEVLQRRVLDVAHRMQCPPDFVAVATVVMFGSIIGTGCAVHPKQLDSWLEYPNLWGGVVASPGSLKTPAIAEAFAPLALLERRAAAEHAQAMMAHALAKVERKLEREALEKQLKKAGASGDSGGATVAKLAELSLEDPVPIARRFRTQDATVEKLGELLSGNPRGMLLDRDELFGFLAALNRPGQDGSRAFYLEGWSGTGSFHTDRIGRGSIYIPQVCVSVFGGIQPGKLQDYMYDAGSNANDGFIQRFQLLVYPNATENRLVIDQLPDDEAAIAMARIAEAIGYGDFTAFGARTEEKNGQTIYYFRYHPDAQHTFNNWLEGLHRKIIAEESPIMAEHLSKFPKLVPALSLIFHLVEMAAARASEPSIPVAALNRALRWAEYLESHARRVYAVGTDYALLAAERLASEIESGSLEDGFSEHDVYRRGWIYLDDAELARAACRELMEAGWLRQVLSAPTVGRPPSTTYQISPRVRRG